MPRPPPHPPRETGREEREAIVAMLRSLHPDENPDALDGLHPTDVLEYVISYIERGVHNKGQV